MNLSILAVKKPITTCMVFLAIVVLGIVSYRQLPVQLIPDMTFPQIGVSARTDSSAYEIQETLTKPIEGIVAEMPRVKSVMSFTRSGRLWMRVEFEYGTDIQYALVDLEERLATFRNSLDNRRTMINSFPFSTQDWQRGFMILSVRAPGDEQTLFNMARESVEQELGSIQGVSNVEMYGLRNDSAEVLINPDKLSSYGLELGQVMNRVQAAAGDDTFLGRLRSPSETFYVRLDDKITNVEELANLYIDGAGVVRLRDVAQVFMGSSVDTWVNRTMGKNSIRIRLEREGSENLISLARRTRVRIDELNQKLPPGMEIIVETDMAQHIEDAIEQVRKLALFGAMLALLVPLFFFRSFRVAMIVFLSVPISLISVFNLFYAAGLSINIFSIVGLALGVGMLVDNSIVVVENSFRLYHRGKSPREAAMLGGADVGRGLLAATLTTVVVFVPIVFLEGEFKLIVKEPTLALIFPLIVSLLVALSLVPVLTWLVLRSKSSRKQGTVAGARAVKVYQKILKAALRYRGRVLLIIAVLLTLTWLEGCQRIQSATTSDQANREYMEFYFESFQGADLADTDRSVRAIEERLLEHPNLESFSVAFDADGGEARLQLLPKDERENKETWQEIHDSILEFMGPIPGLELTLVRPTQNIEEPSVSMGPQGQLWLRGLDNETIAAYAERLIAALRSHPQITSATLDTRRGEPLYNAVIDREMARLFGVNAQQLARYVRATQSEGTISSLRLEEGETQTDVLFTIEGSEGTTVDEVKELRVFSPQGGSVPLGELARFQTGTEPGRIFRRDRQASEDIEYHYQPDTNQRQLVEDIKELVASLPNPGGVVTEFTGRQRRLDQRGQQFGFVILWGAILVWVVMAAVFESFWVPFTILATNPLMLIGIVWGLDLANLPLDDLAAFGVILLIGLAVNNGIVMMDRALNLQRSGFRRSRAIFEAASTRLRPIMMTYFTTALGLGPLALIGEAEDQWRPVAVVVIGGLTSATALTLIVLPCFYLIGDDFVQWARKPFLNFLGALFELPEALAALVFHPIKVLRGQIPFAPAFRRLLWSLITFAFELLRVPIKILVYTPADIMYLLTRPFRIRHPERDELPPGRLARAGVKLRAAAARLFRAAYRGAKWLALQPWRFARFAWRKIRRKKTAAPPTGLGEARAVPAVITEPAREPAPISLTNIHVLFPPAGFKGLRARLPFGSGKEDFRVAALDGVTLDIPTGLVGLLGPNGAGKTTLLRVIAGLQEPTRGTARLFGAAHRDAPGALAPLIGYLPQTHGHYERMSLYQYLDYFITTTAQTLRRARALSGDYHPALVPRLQALADLDNPAARRRAVWNAIHEVNLAGSAHQPIATFSGGMKQRAGIARILLQQPPILIVDEPTAGLDPIERVKVRLLLARLAEQRLVLFSTHIVEDLEHQCDYLTILNRGKLVYAGEPGKLVGSLEGRVWDVLAQPEEDPESLRADLVARGLQILFQVVERGRAGFRVLSAAHPGGEAVLVAPSLEDALLGTLGRPASQGTPPGVLR